MKETNTPNIYDCNKLPKLYYTIYLLYQFPSVEEAENFIDKYEITEPVDIRYKINKLKKEVKKRWYNTKK